ncbi:MAG: hypothetical protein V3T00_01850 [bacterium]
MFTAMYLIKGSVQQDDGIRHYRYTIHLERSLVELFKIYEEVGGPAPHVAALMDARIERCLADTRSPRPVVQSHLHALRRAKDLHQYATSEEELVPVKVSLLEHVLFHRSPEARWAAIRELLQERLDLICETPLPGVACNAELYKEQLSLRSSRLGKLLVATALFNFDLCEEEPPPNTVIRFRARRFPDHTWEAQTARGKEQRLSQGVPDWSPRHPLCRWEYLAADLAHAIFRGRGRAGGPWPVPQRGRPGPADMEQDAPGTGPGNLYCRFAASTGNGEASRQLDLLPVEPESVTPELQRIVHRRHGTDGVRALAALLARFDDSRAGETVTFALGEIAEAAFGRGGNTRTRHSRIRKVRAVLERMGEVECARIAETGSGATVRTSRLLTAIGHSERWAGRLDGITPPSGAAPLDERLTVLLERVFYLPDGGTLGAPYRELPEPIRGAQGKHHPFALALFVFLRQAWSREGVETLELTGQRLFAEAGLWPKPSNPYRSVETLKRDLTFLKEAGYLGGWRLLPAARRGALEDRFRLDPPYAAVRARMPEDVPASADYRYS